jgi:hypothetical protein
MQYSRLLIVPLLLIGSLSAGCTFGSGGSSSGEQSSSASSEAVYVPTPNVTYVGTVSVDGASVLLTLAQGGSVTLMPSDQGMDLTRYDGQEVQVRGSVTPTGSSLTMTVAEVTVLSADSSSSSSSAVVSDACGGIAGVACDAGFACVDDPSDSCDPLQGGADCMGRCVRETASSSSFSAAPVVVRSSSAPAAMSSSVSSVVSSVSSSLAPTTPSDENTALMASQDYSAALWTQKYCTSHIAFCIPVHKNWYFKSFGATTSNLWHVEFGMQSIESIGMGPIVMNLVDSTLETAGATDGSVVRRGSDVIGFASWNDGTHFELIADASLESAVTYMISRITPYTPQ